MSSPTASLNTLIFKGLLTLFLQQFQRHSRRSGLAHHDWFLTSLPRFPNLAAWQKRLFQQRLPKPRLLSYPGKNLLRSSTPASFTAATTWKQLAKLPDACVDLIYIDPPFNSNRNYEVFWGETKEKRAFEDRHESTRAYIDYMRPRCVQLARVLKITGSFYYHCDWHASHYVKVMLFQCYRLPDFERTSLLLPFGCGHGAFHRYAGYKCAPCSG